MIYYYYFKQKSDIIQVFFIDIFKLYDKNLN